LGVHEPAHVALLINPRLWRWAIIALSSSLVFDVSTTTMVDAFITLTPLSLKAASTSSLSSITSLSRLHTGLRSWTFSSRVSVWSPTGLISTAEKGMAYVVSHHSVSVL